MPKIIKTRIAFELPKTIKAKFHKQCKKEGVTMSMLIVFLIREYLSGVESKNG